jgi:hypothetical protein
MWPQNEFFDLNQFACRRRDFDSSNDEVSKKLAVLDSFNNLFHISLSFQSSPKRSESILPLLLTLRKVHPLESESLGND